MSTGGFQYELGGMMRCCLATLEECQNLPTVDGSEVQCKWCEARLVLRGGVWSWTSLDVRKEKCNGRSEGRDGVGDDLG